MQRAQESERYWKVPAELTWIGLRQRTHAAAVEATAVVVVVTAGVPAVIVTATAVTGSDESADSALN